MSMTAALLVTAFALASGGQAPATSLVEPLSLWGGAGDPLAPASDRRVFARALPRSLRGPSRIDVGSVVLESLIGAIGWVGGAAILGAPGILLGAVGIMALGFVGATGGMALGVLDTGWSRGYSGKVWATVLASLLGNALTAGLLYHGYQRDWPGNYVALPLLSAAGSLIGTIAVYHGTSGVRGPTRRCIWRWGGCR